MEWSWKTLLIFIVIALMIGILIDGFRRMRRNQAAALRLDVKGDFNLTDDDDFNSELPSGGARVVSHARTTPVTDPATEVAMDSPIYANDDDSRSYTETSDDERALSVDDDDRRSLESSSERADEQAIEPIDERNGSDEGEGAEISTPNVRPKATQESECSEQNAEQDKEKSDKSEQKAEKEINTNSADAAPASVHFDEPAPVLLNVDEMGSCPEPSDKVADVQTTHEPASSSQDNSAQGNSKQSNGKDDEAKQQEQNPTHHQPLEETPIEPSAAQAASTDDEPDTNDEVADKVTDTVSEPEPVAVKAANVMRPGDHAERLDERESAQEVLVVHVIAQKGTTFSGDDLLYVFNSCDLRLGERDIFHRFEENNGNGRVQFSVSQAYEPGSFDASVLLSQSFSGLSFFMSLPGPKKPLDAYEAMSEMAQFVARNLKGDLLDDSHSAMTMQTMEHHREKIMDFERKQRLKGKSK